jgi:hypothetical protein
MPTGTEAASLDWWPGNRRLASTSLRPMARDDWRIRIELEGEHAPALLERLGLGLGSRARELARELEEHRLVVSREGGTVFVYTESSTQAERAREIVEAELSEAGLQPLSLRIEHWLADEDRWDDEPAGPDVEEEIAARGYAPWEVRVECSSHEDAEALAARLEAEGHEVVRRWRYAIVGAATREEAARLAEQLHGEVEPGGELVWEVMPRNPFAIFGGLGT